MYKKKLIRRNKSDYSGTKHFRKIITAFTYEKGYNKCVYKIVFIYINN